MRNLIKNIIMVVLLLLLIAGIFSLVNTTQTQPTKVGVNRLVAEINASDVSKISIQGNLVNATLKNTSSTVIEVTKESTQTFSQLIQPYKIAPHKLESIDIKVQSGSGWKYWLSIFGPYMITFLLIGGLIFFMTRQVQGANSRAIGFGQSSAKQTKPDDKNKKTFKDIAGAKEAKEELEEIVDFLKDPKKFTDMGAKIPKGVLLMGAPGTGKTLLAKAVSGEADVPFFHMSGSEFVEMFVGVGASRVRDLFNKAKKAAPAIVFIDEIDAVGRKRGAGLGGSHDEREQTLNQILVEMDGFDPNLGVIVIAATNRPDVLDSALLRPGRFDRRVVIDKPDIKDREQILKVHVKNKPLAKDVDLKKLAERTPGFTGADLENLLNEAAILAVREGQKRVQEKNVLESIEKVMLGPQRKSSVMTKRDREMTAYHEAGHAVVAHFSQQCDPVRKVSIIGRGMAGGYTLSMPTTDVHYKTLGKFKDELAMAMGGFVAERTIYGDDALSTGPSNDLKQATQMATNMVMQYGMSDRLGPRQYGDNEEMIFLAEEIHSKKNYSEKTAELIDAEIMRLLEGAKSQAQEIFTEHHDQVEKLVAHLKEKETVEQEEFRTIMGPRPSDKSEMPKINTDT